MEDSSASDENNLEIEAVEGWKNIQADFDSDEIYIGGTCALLYGLDFDEYLKSKNSSDYVSALLIVNSTGCDKKELAVFGKQKVDKVGSLPLKYYHCTQPKATKDAVRDYLSKINEALASDGENIKLVLCLPDNVTKQWSFSNIELVKSSGSDFSFKALERIVKCFKYHYRKLQIIKNIVHGDSKQLSFIDNINMISAAWHNISCNFIQQVFYPCEENEGVDESEASLSLSKWCTSYNVPLNVQATPNILDDFIMCDHDLPNIQMTDDVKSEETKFSKGGSTSETEAYQAMKRLVSYLQGENADPATIRAAKTLEDHLECGAISEIHQFFTNS